MISQSSAFSFRQESLCTCAVESCQLTCTSADIPNLFPFTNYAWTTTWIPYPNFYACDTLHQVFQCTFIPESTIYWKQCNKMSTKIEKMNTYDEMIKSGKNKHEWQLNAVHYKTFLMLSGCTNKSQMTTMASGKLTIQLWLKMIRVNCLVKTITWWAWWSHQPKIQIIFLNLKEQYLSSIHE